MVKDVEVKDNRERNKVGIYIIIQLETPFGNASRRNEVTLLSVS